MIGRWANSAVFCVSGMVDRIGNWEACSGDEILLKSFGG